MTPENLLTVWSIRLALLLFTFAVVARARHDVRSAPGGVGWQIVRIAWVTGCLLAIVHVCAVFGFAMHWSHRAAVADTARRTNELIGVPVGFGVYFNYLFLVVWVCDAAWWCGWPDTYRQRPRLWDVVVIGYLWFIAFNAAVVFETGVIRWLGLMATLAMIMAATKALPARKELR